MKKQCWHILLVSFILISSQVMAPGFTALADSNYTSAVQFGFGAQINPHTENINTVIRNASQIGFNWLAVEFDWSLQWPDPSQPIDLSRLNQAVVASRPYRSNLMVTIINPPPWAVTPQGPNPDFVTTLATTIMQTSPDIIEAIELFPGANQARHWGAPANPTQFALVLKQAQVSVAALNPSAVVVASITPLGEERQEGDFDDLEFLKSIYQIGSDQRFPVIGLNFIAINGVPTQDPLADSAHNLRHYEEVRKVMLDYGRSSDLIWVTSFSWPNAISENQKQAEWLFEAYKMLRTQLYIGAAFFKNLNSSDPANANGYLINQNIITHPAGLLLQQLTMTNQAGSYSLEGAYQKQENGLSSILTQILEKIRSWLGL